jgi:glycosyltransferase involved in cell wall biosynthesis
MQLMSVLKPAIIRRTENGDASYPGGFCLEGLSLRIAHVVSSYHPQLGGVETHVRQLARGCAEAGDEVTVLTHLSGDSLTDEWIDTVRVRRFPLTVGSPRNYPISSRLFHYLRSHTVDFDLVHVHSYHTIVGHAAVGSGLPMVFTPHYHGTGHTPLRAALHRLYRPVGARLFRAADAVICVSDAERHLVIRDFPGVARKVGTIPNGTDPRLPPPDQESVMQREPVVLTVGRLERYKNVDLIIDAFRALPCSAVLVVVGDGPDRSRLERHAEASEPGWPVYFTGRISDAMLRRWFTEAKVVTSASDHEAFGLTLAEGLVSGARVVASAIPAHTELARLAGGGAPITLVDPREARRFTALLAEALRAGQVSTRDLKLPSWAEVIGDTRDLYSRVSLQGRPAERRDP